VAGTALILGARNLGGAIAEHLASGGWNVAGVARSDETAESLRRRIPDALALSMDAGTPAAVDDAVARTRERFGALDLMVNAVAAGPAPSGGPFGGGPVADVSEADFDHYALQVARQTYAFIGAGARAMRESAGGTLVQITGGSSRRAIRDRGPWAAGAFATRALTQSAALELRDEGIHVALLIVDGIIASPKTAPMSRGRAPEALVRQEDVIEAVCFLAAQSARGMTHELVITPAGDRWLP
jgi:NAD(P)-dependent dehydrogenase (short-subunit alcohol dehydrogenase family)